MLGLRCLHHTLSVRTALMEAMSVQKKESKGNFGHNRNNRCNRYISSFTLKLEILTVDIYSNSGNMSPLVTTVMNRSEKIALQLLKRKMFGFYITLLK